MPPDARVCPCVWEGDRLGDRGYVGVCNSVEIRKTWHGTCADYIRACRLMRSIPSSGRVVSGTRRKALR
eukprot:365837-Chlamydomonas_euryale.AAC.5